MQLDCQRGRQGGYEYLSTQERTKGSITMKEGYLLKRSDTLKRWRNRWFRLDNKNGRLLYKENKDDKVLKGFFPLVDVSVGPLQSPSKHLVSFSSIC